MAVDIQRLFDKLGLAEINPGACTGGGWCAETDGREELISYNPTTGEPLGRIAQANADDYEHVVHQAEEAFASWRMVPAPVRGEIVRQIGEELRKYKEPLGKLVSLEMGKIYVEGLGEVQEMIDVCDFAVGLSRQLYGLSMHSERPGHRMYEQWHPLGPIGVITAFNFPVAVWAWNAAIAAICGDTVIWKPSSKAPLCAVAVQNIMNRVMENNSVHGVFSICIGNRKNVGEKMIADKRLPLISATGSVAMGKRVSSVVGGRLGRTLLELGGNNAIIVDETADLDLATRAILFGAVGTAGQRCTSTRRIFMQSSIAEDLSARLVKAYRQVQIGDPLDEHTLMGPLVDRAAVDTMMAAVKELEDGGAEILIGGNPSEIGGNFVQPTIVKTKHDTRLVHEETFAPILYLIEYDKLEDAIAWQNEVPQGLSSAIFSTHMRATETFLSHKGSDCGIANVNIGTSGAEIGGAFGGEKDTGGGRESGSDSWKSYMRRQTCTINWSKELPLAQGIKFGDD